MNASPAASWSTGDELVRGVALGHRPGAADRDRNAETLLVEPGLRPEVHGAAVAVAGDRRDARAERLPSGVGVSGGSRRRGAGLRHVAARPETRRRRSARRSRRAAAPGSTRASTFSVQRSGTMLSATPPLIGPMPIVACGIENDGSLASVASWRSRSSSATIRCAAARTALTPADGVAECAARPWRAMSSAALPLWRSTTRSSVGSPTTTPASGAATRRRRARRGAARCPRRRAPRRARSPRAAARAVTTGRTRATAASVAAMKPFMSAAPRPWSRPPSARRMKGSLVQVWPATSTTSPCAASSTPPGASAGPSTACRTCVPGRVPSCTRTSAPASSRTVGDVGDQLAVAAAGDRRPGDQAGQERGRVRRRHRRGQGPSRPRSPPGSAARRPRPVASARRLSSRASPMIIGRGVARDRAGHERPAVQRDVDVRPRVDDGVAEVVGHHGADDLGVDRAVRDRRLHAGGREQRAEVLARMREVEQDQRLAGQLLERHRLASPPADGRPRGARTAGARPAARTSGRRPGRGRRSARR